jgi:hypothetical protein
MTLCTVRLQVQQAAVSRAAELVGPAVSMRWPQCAGQTRRGSTGSTSKQPGERKIGWVDAVRGVYFPQHKLPQDHLLGLTLSAVVNDARWVPCAVTSTFVCRFTCSVSRCVKACCAVLCCCMLQLPTAWAAAAYPSSKPVGSWMADLVKRVAFIRQWLTTGEPVCFWLPGGLKKTH